MEAFKRNCCDGIYNSFDVHFTSLCDNRCAHCIDGKYNGIGIKKPNPYEIAKTIIDHRDGYDDVLFLGGEPCLFMDELLTCISLIRTYTKLKVYVTTSMPATCVSDLARFRSLLEMVDGINISAQHNDERIAEKIRRRKNTYDRQAFYASLPNKHKIRINLNIVKPFLYTREQVTACIEHYDKMGFNEIKLSEIQHGKEFFVSFEKMFGISLGSPFYHGCQTKLDISTVFPNTSTPVLLKRSCFACEYTLKASFLDGVKVLHRMIYPPTNKYGVVYENGLLTKQWR